jgi:hypothetical protein
LSVAFDLATHRGYDSDHERVKGDVGMAGKHSLLRELGCMHGWMDECMLIINAGCIYIYIYIYI